LADVDKLKKPAYPEIEDKDKLDLIQPSETGEILPFGPRWRGNGGKQSGKILDAMDELAQKFKYNWAKVSQSLKDRFNLSTENLLKLGNIFNSLYSTMLSSDEEEEKKKKKRKYRSQTKPPLRPGNIVTVPSGPTGGSARPFPSSPSGSPSGGSPSGGGGATANTYDETMGDIRIEQPFGNRRMRGTDESHFEELIWEQYRGEAKGMITSLIYAEDKHSSSIQAVKDIVVSQLEKKFGKISLTQEQNRHLESLVEGEMVVSDVYDATMALSTVNNQDPQVSDPSAPKDNKEENTMWRRTNVLGLPDGQGSGPPNQHERRLDQKGGF